ncbi:MAG TPA: hypothetical protein VI815_02570 [Candidatus Nanoarchaeia archaeon]|nr:hypothetical protein [Candidatus Nanoarchaeia archaeon]
MADALIVLKLRQNAYEQVMTYPQYKGHFDNYVLIQVKKRIKTKMGNILPKGSITICNPVIIDDRFSNKSVLVWSFTHKIDITVQCKDIAFI